MTTAPITSSKKKRNTPEFIESFIDTLKQNGGMLTIFAVVLIFVSGVTLVDNPSNWWISVASISFFFVTVFLYMNARVFIKAAVALITTTLLSSFAFNIGSYADPQGAGGLVWMCSIFFLFFTCLAVSYLVSSSRSRWGSLIGTQLISFVSTYAALAGFENVALGTLTGLFVGLAFFFVIYKLSGVSRVSKKDVPTNLLTESFISSVETGAAANAMDSFVLARKEENKGSMVIWRDRAYLLHPVTMENAFSSVGRKGNKLGYMRKNANPWLLNIAFSETPVWKSRGASIMTVLVDLKDANGSTPKVIGVSVPDTKRKLPIGVIPGKVFSSGNSAKIEKALEELEDEFRDFTTELTEKQKTALSRFGVPVEVEK